MRPTRRQFLEATSAGLATTLVCGAGQPSSGAAPKRPAQIAITLDLEMSRHYPQRGMLEWDYRKGDLDRATKDYSLQAARVASERDAVIHCFCVAQVLEQSDINWLKQIAALGHPIGNHTYDHVNVHAATREQIQFRFQRAPWLIEGQTVPEIIQDNVHLATLAMRQRAEIEPNGFRTPGGFRQGLQGREDLQKMLQAEGFTWVSSQYPAHKYGKPGKKPPPEVFESIVDAQQQAQPYRYPTGLIEIPMSPISDVSAFRTARWELDWFLEATRRSLKWVIAEGAVFDFLAHPSCLVVEDPNFEIIKLICEMAEEAGSAAEIVGLDRIAERVAPA